MWGHGAAQTQCQRLWPRTESAHLHTRHGAAIQRGVARGWLPGFYQNVADRAWDAVVTRTDASWGLLDMCESTPGQDSLDAYLHRKALSGRDDRAGGMLLLFASERLHQ